MTTIDRWAAEKRVLSKGRKARVFTRVFLEMLMGRREPKRGYLNSLYAPVSFPAFFLFVLIVISFALIAIFGLHP
jgi:hypothetical protein